MVEVLLDVEQQRLTRSALVAEGDGSRWDTATALRTVVSEDGMVFVEPYQLTPEWDTTTTTNYARWSRSDYRKVGGGTLSSSQWVENHRGLSGNIFLESMGVDEAVYSNASWPINRGFFLSFYVPEGAGDNNVLLEFGWGETGTNGSVMVRVWGSGRIDVLKRASGAWALSGTYQADGAAGKRVGWKSKKGGLVSMMLLPCAARDLLISTSTWGEIRHSFPDLSADVVNTITPAGRVWWHWRQQKASVQCSELRFPTASGSLWTQVDELREAPPLLSTLSGNVYFTRPTASDTATSAVCQLMEGDSPGTVFVPNGSRVRCRVLVQLVATAQYTPFVFAAYIRVNVATGLTPAEDTDLSPNVIGFSLSVPDSESATGSLEVRHEDASPDNWVRQSFRPVRLSIDDSAETLRPILWGQTQPPKFREAQREVAGSFRRLTLPYADAWELIADVIFEEDGYPYDGWPVINAIDDLLTIAGWPTDPLHRNLTTSSARLDYNFPLVERGKQSGPNWSWKPQAGDSVGQWIKKIYDTFLPTWLMGINPGTDNPIFYLLSPADIGTTAVANIFLHKGASPTGRIPCYDFTEETLPAEATSITVWGFNPSTKTLLRARWADGDLSDPTLDSVDRPTGWRGGVSPYVMLQPKLTTPQTVGLARNQLAAKIGVEQRLAEWECPLLFKADHTPLWRGDCVAIWPGDGGLAAGDPEGGIYRVRSLSLSWRRDAMGAEGVRRVRYTGERVGNLVGNPPTYGG